MNNKNEMLYENISEAVAFEVSFENMIYSYGSVDWDEIEQTICSRCGKTEQYNDFLTSKSNCKKDYGILDSYHYGVSKKIKDDLILNFDITESDFRPIRNKVGEIVFFQITPNHKMLPIGSVNRIKQLVPCKKCGSVQYRINEYKNKKGAPFYFINREALDDLHDINVTYEEFDMFLPRVVVSRRVYIHLTKMYPRMRFVPLFLK